MTLRLRTIAVALMLGLIATPAVGAMACDAASLEKGLRQAERNFAKPSVRAKLDKAKADWAEDQDFDDEDAASYLAAVALYHDINRNFGAGYVDEACKQYDDSAALFDLIEAAE